MAGKRDGATGPLAGVRAIECAQVVAGPTCGYMLADLGADVIKVERAPMGDDVRRMTPPSIEGESAAFMMLNRNKRAIALDLKQESAKEAFLRLVRTADVLIENYRPGAMERMGLGYGDLKAENPALVYATISGFGRTGPYAGRGGYDLVAQAMSGLMSITGEAPGRPPVKVGSPIADFAAGILAALGIVSAYTHRLKTGEGQYLETSLFEAAISATFHQTAMFLATGEPRPRSAPRIRWPRHTRPTRPPTAGSPSARATTPTGRGSPGPWARRSSPRTRASSPTTTG